MSHGIFESCACKENEHCTCNCHYMSAEEILPKPVIEPAPTRHAQALARIEEWRNANIEIDGDESMSPKDLQKEIALELLKAVLELHKEGKDANETWCDECGEFRYNYPCPTADLVIRGLGMKE